MRRRSRFLRIAKWTGLILCLLLLVVWGASITWEMYWTRSDGALSRTYGVGRCGVMFWRVSASHRAPPPGFVVRPCDLEASAVVRRYALRGPVIRWFTVQPWTGSYWIPLWHPLLLCAFTTVILFWYDYRRPPKGHCQRCGYDLTGNVSGVCPECSEPT